MPISAPAVHRHCCSRCRGWLLLMLWLLVLVVVVVFGLLAALVSIRGMALTRSGLQPAWVL